jgi:RNA polymerase sigma-70 factor (ECF subfamily)
MNATLPINSKPALRLIDRKRAYAEATDFELVVACQNRNALAFEELVKRNQRTVYGLLHQIAPDWRDTADLAQEVFIRVWRSISTLRNPHSFKTWLNHIVTNLFYDELRKRPKQFTVSIDEPVANDNAEEGTTRDLPDVSRIPEEVVQRNELCCAINDAILGLPEQFRTTIVLRELQGLSYDEIATITRTERGTVKSRIARARAKIQHALAPYLKDCA